MSNRFRTVALALRDHISDTYSLLAAADAIMALDAATPARHEKRLPRDLLVSAALGSVDVMRHVKRGEKIYAIKALRSLGDVGDGNILLLKDVKEAIEDKRVWEHAPAPYGD